MITSLKLIAILSLWSVVAYIMIFLEPNSIKDVLIESIYLPFLVAVTVALGYTMSVIANKWWLAASVTGLLMLGLVLSILGLLNTFLVIVIALMIVFACYLSYLA